MIDRVLDHLDNKQRIGTGKTFVDSIVRDAFEKIHGNNWNQEDEEKMSQFSQVIRSDEGRRIFELLTGNKFRTQEDLVAFLKRADQNSDVFDKALKDPKLKKYVEINGPYAFD